jgi:succinate-semialdehyde dehydrogenase/glutarate-semialdehyde dehydrogenase
MTTEQGKPLKEAEGEVEYAASFIQWFAEQAKRTNGEIIPPAKPGSRILATREPIGVVAAITPWNFPMAMLTRKLGPALAAGCTGIIKPANNTPLSAFALLALAKEAGVPDGVLNAVAGDTHAISDAIMASKAVRKISFTGSTQVGKLLMRNAAETMKKVSMELGGNAPYIVFDDADIDAAVQGAIANKFRNAGQVCVSVNRFYIHNAIYDRFTQQLAAEVNKLKVGNGMEEGVIVGPLIEASAVEKVEQHVNDAVAKGGKLLAGGERHALGGNFWQPTVITEAHEGMQLAQEETFGPVAACFRFDDEDEVIRRANDTPFGLAAYFYTQNLQRVFRVSAALESGMIGINECAVSTELAPFGGVKESGLGREGSVLGMEEYLEVKALHLGGLS